MIITEIHPAIGRLLSPEMREEHKRARAVFEDGHRKACAHARWLYLREWDRDNECWIPPTSEGC